MWKSFKSSPDYRRDAPFIGSEKIASDKIYIQNEREDFIMDVKEQIKKAVDKITKDKNLQEQFQKEPVKALESVLGVDLPDDVINQVVDGVKAKLTVDKVSDTVDALKGFLKK